jgi:hypothetical protein
MAVYVDDMYKTDIGKFGRMKMSHLMADTTEELLQMLDRIGVRRKWIQKQGTKFEHFDICISKRKKAIELGAIPIYYGGAMGRALSVRTGPNDPFVFEKEAFCSENTREST